MLKHIIMILTALLAWSGMAQDMVTVIQPFTPAELSTDVLIGWYDASIAPSGTAVIATDMSGNGNHLTGNGNPQSGVRSHNGINVIDMDGDDYFEENNFPVPSSGDITVIMVAGIDAIDSNNDSIHSFNADNDYQLESGSSPQFMARFNNAGMASGDPEYGTNSFGPSIYVAVADFTGAGTIYVQVDGINSATDNYTGKIGTPSEFRLFSNRGESQRPDGWIGEALVLATGDITIINKCVGRCAHKWGLTGNLPDTHPYKYIPPPSGTNTPSFLVDDSGNFITAKE